MDVTQRAWFWGLVGVGVVMLLYFVLALLGWPGSPSTCTLPGGNCYCEAFPPPPATAVAMQPANTWSGLSAIVAGLAILAIADRDRRSGASANPMASGGFYAVLFGAVALFLGPGSMFFHGSLTRFGGWVDNLSMILFVTFLLLYDVFRVLGRDGNRTAFSMTFVAVNAVLGVLTWVLDGTGTIVFAVLAVATVAAEILIVLRRPRGLVRSFAPWLLGALVAFGVALVIWRLSWTGAPLCDPESLLQGHALWHLLAMAVTPFLVFLYLRDETRAGPLASSARPDPR